MTTDPTHWPSTLSRLAQICRSGAQVSAAACQGGHVAHLSLDGRDVTCWAARFQGAIQSALDAWDRGLS